MKLTDKQLDAAIASLDRIRESLRKGLTGPGIVNTNKKVAAKKAAPAKKASPKKASPTKAQKKA